MSPQFVLPAAVFSADDPRAAEAARIVPANARLVRIGSCTAGYYHRPARHRRVSVSVLRLAEIERLARDRFKDAPPDASTARRLARAVADHADAATAARWIARWCVTLHADEREDIVTSAASRATFWSADALALLLNVTNEERRRLKLRTVGAVDCDKRQRTLARKQRNRDRMRAARAAQPKVKVMSQEQAAPWRAAGLSRRTWFRRRAAAMNVSTGTDSVRNNDSGILRREVVPPAATFDVATSGGSAADRIVAVMGSGVIDVAAIVRLSGLDHRVVRPVLSRLVKAGRIIRVARGIYQRVEQQAVVAAQGESLVRYPVDPAPDQPGARERASEPPRPAVRPWGAIGSSGGGRPVRRAAPLNSSVFAPRIFPFPFPTQTVRVLRYEDER